MNVVCLDLEGVLVGEVWIEFSEASGIPELSLTTRDEPDYDKLMNYRIGILREHGLGLSQIQEIISTMEPLPGAREFLDKLRTETQAIIVSDTFSQFAKPLMEKLGWPTILCNELTVDETGMIVGYKMRKAKTKRQMVELFQEMGYNVIASGDSYNDVDMLEAAQAGFLFRTTDALKEAYPQFPAYDSYDDLLAAIEGKLYL